MQSRTSKSILNISTALIGQFLAIIVGFITRMVFVKQLGDTYLGINGLCTSIVGLLSLAELGIGESINYKLYKPLADNDTEKIKTLMKLYQTVYRIIGAVILVIGLVLLPFLKVFMKASDVDSVDNLYIIFILFIVNSASSYFYSYKRALIISDQKRYIVTLFHYSFYCLMNIGQIIILLKTKNFILYLLIMLVCTVAQNILISIKADKIYPYLKDKEVTKLEQDDVDEIKKNTLALLFHKIGSQVVNSTDNILISKVIGIVIVGIYSNYLLVTTALNTIVAQLFSAITASVGNLGATVEEKKSEQVLKRLFFGNYVFVSIICASFYSSIDLLINKMFGDQRVVSHSVLVCIVINLFLYNIRRTAWTFRDGYGLFWYDRYKAIAEAIINLVVSIILGLKIGLVGILIGTIVSTVTTSLWIEPYILYKYAFKKKATNYFITLLIYTILTFFACLISRVIVTSLNLNGYIGFIFGCIISTMICCITVFICFYRTEEMKYYKALLLQGLKRIRKIKV